MEIVSKKVITQGKLFSLGSTPYERICMAANNLYVDIRDEINDIELEPVRYELYLKAVCKDIPEKEKKYLHQIENRAEIVSGMSFARCNELYKQPDWCVYEDAISTLGCMALMFGEKLSAEDCKFCEFNKTLTRE
jgi:hypothetical protein